MSVKIEMGSSPLAPVETLAKLGSRHSSAYQHAQPYAHVVLDDVFDETVIDEVLREFKESDSAEEVSWKQYDTAHEKKLQMNRDLALGPITRSFIHELNSAPFLEFLEELTGITGLIPDPHLVGGGLHKIAKGGKLGIHVDFNRHKRLRLFRRLNVIIYLNKDWQEAYGGHFELWDEKKEGCVKKVLPIFNRMAIFSTTSTSFHGHPEPLTCQDDRFRRSLALYYYTAEERGEQDSGAHTTIFLDEEGKRIKQEKPSLLRRVQNRLFSNDVEKP